MIHPFGVCGSLEPGRQSMCLQCYLRQAVANFAAEACVDSQANRRAPMTLFDATQDRPWTIKAVQQLLELAREQVPVSVMSLKLCRSVGAIHAKLAELGATPGRET